MRTLPRGMPVRVLSADDSRTMDRRCAEEFGLPTLLLMENAAARVAEVALSMLAREARAPRASRASPGPRSARAVRAGVLVVCGTGGNGGDGLGAARHLDAAGVPVAVVLSGEPRAGSDAALQLAVVRAAGLDVTRVDAPNDGAAAVRAGVRALAARGARPALVIDALLGSGLRGPARAPVDAMIAAINALRQRSTRDTHDMHDTHGTHRAGGPRVLAIDVPSGMDADAIEHAAPERSRPKSPAPQPPRAIIRADVTLALVGLKPALLTPVGRRQAGRLIVADIGVPRVLREASGRSLPASPDPGAG